VDDFPPLALWIKGRLTDGKDAQKADLPQKICAGCGLPMVWRKKWEKVWDEVRFCSDRCRQSPANKGKAK
jgi:hypothetical protein